MPDGLGMTLERALELSPDLKSLPARGPVIRAGCCTARKVLEGLARHASTHAAGVLITPGPLLDYVPLYRQKDESITTQWDMKSVEKAGLLKMDFLGLRTLSVLDEAVQLVEATPRRRDRPRPPARGRRRRPTACSRTPTRWRSSSSSRPACATTCKQLKPTRVRRPGGDERALPARSDGEHSRTSSTASTAARWRATTIPALEPILKGTYGVFVYQEQVMAAANVLAGFSLAQADELRRAMGKKRPEEMEAKRAEFVDGCAKNQDSPREGREDLRDHGEVRGLRF